MATAKKKKVVKKEEDEIEEGALGGEGEVQDEAPAEEVEEEGADEVEESSGKSDVVFVNREKLSRAKGILELVAGKRQPRDANEAERLDHYRGLMAHAGVKPSDKKALRFIYESCLGGLVRSESEQLAADKKAAAMKAKHKKRAIPSEEKGEE